MDVMKSTAFSATGSSEDTIAEDESEASSLPKPLLQLFRRDIRLRRPTGLKVYGWTRELNLDWMQNELCCKIGEMFKNVCIPVGLSSSLVRPHLYERA